MIVFTPIKDFSEYILDSMGLSVVAKYNFTSMIQDAIQLNHLSSVVGFLDLQLVQNYQLIDFDIAYHNVIISNDLVFADFMSIIVSEMLNSDSIVQVLIDRSDFRDALTESLMKLIQQRYGINTFFIFEESDLQFVSEQDPSIEGINNLDMDIARWNHIVYSIQGNTGFEVD